VVENCMLLSLLIYKIYHFVIGRNSEGQLGVYSERKENVRP
jgi:hypothetical protein